MGNGGQKEVAQAQAQASLDAALEGRTHALGMTDPLGRSPVASWLRMPVSEEACQGGRLLYRLSRPPRAPNHPDLE